MCKEQHVIAHVHNYSFTSKASISLIKTMRTRDRNKDNVIDENKVSKIRVLRSTACMYVIEQLPGATCNVDNIELGCEHCHDQLNNPNKRNKRKSNNLIVDPRCHCIHPFLKDNIRFVN